MDTFVSIATVAVVIALVNVAKQFGVKGRYATLLAVILGVVISLIEYAATNPVDLTGLYQAAAVGLIIGLTAAGVYDVSMNAGGATQVVNVPIVAPTEDAGVVEGESDTGEAVLQEDDAQHGIG